MATLEADGARIHYERRGSGPPLLHISGTGSDLRRPPSPFAWPGAAQFDLAAYDHRGLGRSTVTDERQPTMADFAADALALADALGWRRFSVVGVSFGGMVAQEVAIRAPGRVERLVLACTSSGGAGGCSAPLHEILALPSAERRRTMVALLDTRTATDPQLRDDLAQLVAIRDEELSAPAWRQLEARRTHDTWERLGAIGAATLVAAGRYDGIAPLANSRALAGAIDGAQLEAFEGGHPFLQQDPRAWPAVASFLLAGQASSARSASTPSQTSA
jgi:3-oxoadipate enol-lactonase